MSYFKINKVNLGAASVSEQLRLCRIKNGLSLGQVARYLDVSIKYLKALESANYYILPPGIYGRHYLREYAHFLGLNYKELLVNFEKEQGALGLEVSDEDYFTKLKNSKKLILYIPDIFKNLLIFAGVIVCFFYLGGAVLNIFSPPSLYVFNPRDNLVTSERYVDISGIVDEQAQVIINGELIASAGGLFKRGVYLKEGINIINIIARRKFGNESVIQRKILVNKNL